MLCAVYLLNESTTWCTRSYSICKGIYKKQAIIGGIQLIVAGSFQCACKEYYPWRNYHSHQEDVYTGKPRHVLK